MSTETQTDSAEVVQEQVETLAADANPSDMSEAQDTGEAVEGGNETDKAQDSSEESTIQNEEVKIDLPEDSLFKNKDELFGLLENSTKSQEGFDKLNEYVKEVGENALEAQKKSEDEAWENTKTKWADELKQDPNFGKDYEGNKKLAMQVADDIGMGDFLRETGFEGNPEVLKGLAKIGKERQDAAVHMGNAVTKSVHKKNPDGTTAVEFNLDYTNK